MCCAVLFQRAERYVCCVVLFQRAERYVCCVVLFQRALVNAGQSIPDERQREVRSAVAEFLGCPTDHLTLSMIQEVAEIDTRYEYSHCIVCVDSSITYYDHTSYHNRTQ